MAGRNSAATLAVTVCLALPLTTVPSTSAAAASRAAAFDFNGDGYADLAVGSPGEDVGTALDAGAVNVLYGTATGITVRGDQVLSQATTGVIGASETGDRFGAAVESGDFNRDGYADLAVGVPGEALGAAAAAGAVQVLYGTSRGLRARGDQFLTQPRSSTDAPEADDRFGSSLAVGDFDRDGFHDLAIGTPGENLGDVPDAGSVTVIHGSAVGLPATRTQEWSQESPGVLDQAETTTYTCEGQDEEPVICATVRERFGGALAAGDLNGDGYADLAVGVPGETGDAGAVNVIFGGPGGLSASGNQYWDQNSAGVKDGVEPATLDTQEAFLWGGDSFGRALAIGDFNGDRRGDLAVGVPDEQIDDAPCNPNEGPCSHGAVNVLYGSAGGLTATGDDFWPARDFPPNGDESTEHPLHGASLAAADVNGDGVAELAIGIPGFGRRAQLHSVGAVEVLRGRSGSGLTRTGRQLWTQNSPGVAGAEEAGDTFGSSLRIAQYGRSRHRDLAIGVPLEDTNGLRQTGIVHVLFGTSAGLRAAGDQVFGQDTPGVTGSAERDDFFGTLR